MDIDKLQKDHSGKLSKLLQIYNIKGDLYRGSLLKISVGIDLFFLVVVFISKINSFELLKTLTDLYLTILPSLLGFNLGAYALLIGLASSELIKKMSATFETKFTSFQRASSVFGFCVLLEVIALIIVFLFKMELTIASESTGVFPILNDTINLSLNMIGFFILNLFGIYSILILISVVGSIFAISQAAHFFAVTDHIKESQKKIESNSEENGI